MPKGYVILAEAIRDPEGMRAYSRAAGAALAGGGMTVLVVDQQPEVLEGEWPATQTVVLEFESPRDGFRLPAAGDRVRLFLEDGREVEVNVESGLGTHAGPHASGLTLRLALRTAPGNVWRQGAALLAWTAAGQEEAILVDIP